MSIPDGGPAAKYVPTPGRGALREDEASLDGPAAGVVDRRSRSSRLLRAGLVWVSGAAVLVAAGWWAGATASQPPTIPPAELPEIEYTVEQGRVERTVAYSASAQWPSTPVGVNGHSGTLTSIDVQPGDVVGAGDVLYTVDLRPAVAAGGAVPAFRDLAEGARGADVEQLERFLAERQLLDGAPDDRFTATTSTAVRRWQRDLGVPPDGVVRRGDLVFLPALPTPVLLDPEIRIGSALESGAAAVLAVDGPPSFTIDLSREQADLVPLSSLVRLRFGSEPDRLWEGVVESATAVPPSEVVLNLTGPDGGPLCEEACAVEVPVGATTLYTAELLLVPSTEGPVVPTAAVASEAGGRTVVTLVDGSTVPVQVLASADGRSVVDGVAIGDRIRILQDGP